MKNKKRIIILIVMILSIFVWCTKPEYVNAATKYTIKYELNGGTNNKSNPSKYKSTKKVVLKDPTKKGYIFKGWYTDSKFKKEVTTIKKGNKKIYAKWEAIKYTIKFDKNGATSGKMNNMNKLKYNKSYKLTKNAYKRVGYDFVGWNTKKDGSGKSYKNKESIKKLTTKNNKTVTLYAQWQKTKYTITYNIDDETNNKNNPAKYYITTKTIKLQDPTRDGYIFKGWYTDNKYKNKITEIKKGSTGNKKVYAKWEAIKYTITFDGNGATSGKMDNLTDLIYYKSYTLPKNTFKKTNRIFKGWNTNKDGSGTTYTDGQSIKKLTTKNNKTVTLYAIWKNKELNNSTKKDYDFNYVKNVTKYEPQSKNDLINIIYTMLNNSTEELKFNCPSDYKTCVEDTTKLIDDTVTLSHINNFVHPYNKFNIIKMKIINSKVTLKVEYKYNKEEINEINKYVDNTISKYYDVNKDDYTNIKAIHDYIIDNTKYDTELLTTGTSKYKSDTAYGAVVDHYAVCSGYTDLMAIILTKLNFMNYEVSNHIDNNSSSVGHIWNAVYVNDKWLHLDLTWDDPVSSNGKDYLLHD